MPARVSQDEHHEDHGPESLNHSHHHVIVHPNEEQSPNVSIVQSLLPENTKKPWTWINSKFVVWFKNYDEQILKPIFVRNYNSKKPHEDDNFKQPLNLGENVHKS